jgi:carbamoylphosphate synthase large subunit
MRDQGTRPPETIDCSSLTDEERQFLRVSANLLAEIAVAEGPVPMQCLANIAEMLGWPRERAARVARGLARFGLVSKRSAVRAATAAWGQSHGN